MLQRPNAARCNDGNRHAVGHGAGQFQVETVARTVAIHTGKQDFSCAQLRHARAPGNRVDVGGLAAAVGEDFPVARPVGPAPGVHCDHDGLAAKRVRGAADQLGIGYCGGVDAGLVSPGQKQPAHILHAAYPAAHGERQEDLLGGDAHHFQHGGAVVR